MLKRILSCLLSAVLLFSMFACTRKAESNTEDDLTTEETTTTPEETTTPEPEPEPVEIKTKKIYLMEGESYTLNYESDGNDSNIEWSSSTDCVTVKDGVVTAVKGGYSKIRANWGNECIVYVLSKKMPIISVNTGGQSIQDRENYVSCQVTVYSDNDDYDLTAAAGIRYRGNSTFNNFAKKPYRIKFNSKTNLLGMNAGAECKSWVLLAECYDDSFSRNAAAYSLAGAILDEYSSDFRYVKVYINGEYKGVYLLAEQSQINSNRVDIEEAGEDTSNLASGYLFEVNASDPYDSTKTFKIYHDGYDILKMNGSKFTGAYGVGGERAHFMTLKNDGFSHDQLMFIKYYLRGVFEIMYQATYKNTAYEFKYDIFGNQEEAAKFLAACSDGNDYWNGLIKSETKTPREAFEAVVDVDSLVKMYIFSEIICNGDAPWKSYYLWTDLSEGGSGKLTFGCPWDHDGAIVNWNTYDYCPTEGYFDANGNVWHMIAMYNGWFRELVREEWKRVYEANNGFETTLNMISSVSKAYESEFVKEKQMWNRQYAQSYQAGLTRDWLAKRIAWMQKEFGK